MTRPTRFLIRMLLFLLVVVGVVALLREGLVTAFNHNVGLNSLILGMLAIGIALNFRRVLLLAQDIRWVMAYRTNQPVTSNATPRLLAPLATMLGERRERLNLSPQTLRTMLDGIASRLDESHEISRYFTGLMIFLGLLGTFWGLSQTIGSIGDVIRNLTGTGNDVATSFAGLKAGLAEPLAGMGTAFSSSLIGLAGSLVLGFLDLQAGAAQNAFYNDLEEWLSTQVRLGSSIGNVQDGEAPVPAFMRALLEQTADSLDNLQRLIAKGEEGRSSTANNMRVLTERLTVLSDQMKTEQTLMNRLGEAQLELRPVLIRLAEGSAGGMDEDTRHYIRNMDQTLLRLVEETVGGRDQLISDMRSEFRLLARTIEHLATAEVQAQQPPPPPEPPMPVLRPGVRER